MEIHGNSNNYIRDYKIIENIGFGAHGFVYKAIKKDQNKLLVIKQIPLCKKEKNVNIDEAKNEAIILKQLDCNYIVKYYESFEEDNNYFIVMEYCEKGDLGSYLSKLKKNNIRLTENEIWKFFIEISLGLTYIHNKKILHRDLKSKNIFLNKDLNIKIGDLGIAKILQDTNHAHTFIGTPFYLSPEICEEKPYNEKSDVWALGCVLYELITFKHPYNASNQAALLLKIISGNYEPINDDIIISNDLKKLVSLLLEKNYMNRPSMKDIIKKDFFIEKCKLLGFYDSLININSLIQSKDMIVNKIKTIKKITYIRPINKVNSFIEKKPNIEIKIKKRNKHLSSLESINSSRQYSSSNQKIINTSINTNDKRKRTSSIEYMYIPTNPKKNNSKYSIDNKFYHNKHIQNLDKINEIKNSLKKISPIKGKSFQQRIASSTPSKMKLINKSESKVKKNKRFSSLSLNKFINKNPVLKRILDKVESKNISLNNNNYNNNINKPKIQQKITNNNNTNKKGGSLSYRINEKTNNEKIDLKHKNMNMNSKYISKIIKKPKNTIEISKDENEFEIQVPTLQEKILDNSFEIIEQGKDKSFVDTLSNISDFDDPVTKKKSKKEINELKEESDSNKSFEDEKVYIINHKIKNNERKKELLNLLKQFQDKYNQLKKEIFNYKKLINCDKLIEMYNEIDKNDNNNNKMEEILLKLDDFIKLNLPKKYISDFKEIFNNFCIYGLELKYAKDELQNLE